MNAKIADRLIMLRKQHGYSQEELAHKLGLSRQAISKWERAESSPDTDNLLALSKLYDLTLDEIINYKPKTNKNEGTKENDIQELKEKKVLNKEVKSKNNEEKTRPGTNSIVMRVFIRFFICIWQGLCLIAAGILRLIAFIHGLFSWIIKLILGLTIILSTIFILYDFFGPRTGSWILFSIILVLAGLLRIIHNNLYDWCYIGATLLKEYTSSLQRKYKLKKI